LCIAVVIVSSLACNRSRRQRDELVERQLRHEPGLVARIRPEDHGLARRQPDAEGEVEPALVGPQHRVRPGGGQGHGAVTQRLERGAERGLVVELRTASR